MHQNKAGEALRRYARAAAIAPRWGGLQLAWGRALEAEQRTAEARDKYTAAAGMDLSADMVGDQADDPFTVDKEKIKDIQIVRTVVGGSTVYQS